MIPSGDGDDDTLVDGDTELLMELDAEVETEDETDVEGLTELLGEDEADELTDDEGDIPAIKYLGTSHPCFSNHQHRCIGFHASNTSSSIKRLSTPCATHVAALTNCARIIICRDEDWE